MINESCTHDDQNRQLIGTWTSIELQKAIEIGYKIVEIIEVLHYDRKCNEIFKPYIKKWLKIKTECSGWPVSCANGKERQQAFLRDCKLKDDLELEIDKMIPNEGLRFIAKLLLNSLWGKLGQRPNLTQTTICSDYNQYRALISDPKLVITGEIMVTENVILVSYEYADDT